MDALDEDNMKRVVQAVLFGHNKKRKHDEAFGEDAD